MKLKEEFIVHNIGEETLLVPTAEASFHGLVQGIHEWDNNYCGCGYSVRNKGGELRWIDKTTGKEHTWASP